MSDLLPNYLTDWEIWSGLLPVPIFAALFAALGATIKVENTRYWHRFVTLFAFSSIGFVIGCLTGQSREPAVSAMIGAILTLIGGALAYLVGANGAANQVMVSAGVGVMVLSLFFGTNWGTVIREDYDLYKQSARYRIMLEEEDLKLRVLRMQEGLPDPPPTAKADEAKGNPPSK